jgi:heme exporter protein A
MDDGVRISFAEVGKRYDARVIFRGVSGEVDPGQVLVITGPNGSGKSTLLSILCGLLRPTRGTVRHVCGEIEIDRSEWRRHLGVVAPSMAVYDELDAMENLLFFARVRGMDSARDRCRAILGRVGLDSDLRTTVRGFSTGMAQRLKIAQALLHDPAVVVLDEPGSNLDPAGKDWLEDAVRKLAEGGKTIVLATNDRREMEWGTGHVALAE